MTTPSDYFNKIRVDYPQAGKDNDSQGFRDNFRNIFNAFSSTNVILDNLNTKAVKVDDEVSDFGYNIVKSAAFQSCVTRIVDYTPSPTSGNVTVNFREGNYQKYSLNSGTTTFSVVNWGDQSDLKYELELSVKPVSTETTTISFGNGTYVPVGRVTNPVVSTETTTLHFTLWTDDGGLSINFLQKGL